jgi:uncharacterized membrane protein
MTNAPRIALITVLALAAAAVVVATPGAAQSDSVPADFEPTSYDRAHLNFWREDRGASATDDCQLEAGETQGGETGDGTADPNTPFCSARLEFPPGSSGSSPDRETRNVAQGDGGEVTDAERDPVRFAMDTDGATDINANPPEYTLRGAGAQNALDLKVAQETVTYSFWYDASENCGFTGNAELEFTMRLALAEEPDATEDEGDQPAASIGDTSPLSATETTTTSCGHVGSLTDENGAVQVVESVSLDQPIEVPEGQTVVVEIEAALSDDGSAVGDLDWSIFFEDENRNSKVVLRTDQALEAATWAEDAQGQPTDVFDPGADDRQLTPNLALRSPFGERAVPSSGFEGSIRAPDGALEDLDPSEDTQRTVDYEVRTSLTENDGALKQYRLAEVDGDRPWRYPEDITEGTYTVESTGETNLGKPTDQEVDLEHTVTMGSAGIVLEPIDGESTSHTVVANRSTTFLMRLENGGTVQDTFEVSASFDFGDGGSWAVDLQGVDARDRVTLDAGDASLLRVTLTPPEGAVAGDAARAIVTAEGLNSGTTETQSVEAQITNTVTRDVELYAGLQDEFEVGVDRTEELRVFAWNQGTAPDSLQASLDRDAFDPDDTDVFDARLPQKTFQDVRAGQLVQLPVEVTTTTQVQEDDTLTFGLELTSRNDAGASEAAEFTATVNVVRDVSVTALTGDNDQATKSVRYGKYNITQDNDGNSCRDPDTWDPDAEYRRKCWSFTNHTYHLFEVENLGDLEENFQLEAVGGQFTASSDCTDILSDRFTGADLVDTMDPNAPGEESTIEELTLAPGEADRFLLRVSYDGRTPHDADVDPNDPRFSRCDWEGYENVVRVTVPDTDLVRNLDTETRVYTQHPGDNAVSEWNMDQAATANLALHDEVIRNGSLVEPPDFTPIESGETAVLPFTLVLQSAHYDPAQLDVLTDLDDEGWNITLVTEHEDDELALSGVPTNTTDDGRRIVPATGDSFGAVPGNGTFHEASGTVIQAAVQVTPPEEGLQEGQRETLTLEAASNYDANERETLDLGVQIGSRFDFQVTPEEPEPIEAPPGGSAAFALGIENTGASRDTYTVDATVTPAEFDEPVVRNSNLEVSAGTDKTASVQLDVPESATSGSTAEIEVTVTADGLPEGQDTVTRTLQVDVGNQGTLSLEGPDQDARIGPEGDASLTYTIVNEGQTARDVTVSELVAPAGFDTTLSDGPVERTVDADSEQAFTLQFTAPDDVLTGSVFPFTLRAEDADDPDDFGTAAGQATVVGQTAVDVRAEEDQRVVERGGNVTFPVLVNNPGNEPATYDLRATFESADWSARLLDADRDPLGEDVVTVPERSFERVFVDVRAPTEVPEGYSETITFTARAQSDADVSDQVQLTGDVQDFGVAVEVTGAQTKDAAPGQDVAYTLSVTNTGNGEDRIELGFEGADAESPIWPTSAELEDGTTPLLEPGETLSEVTVLVQVPGPDERPVPVPEGVDTVVRATSAEAAPERAPTATAELTTRLVKYQPIDVDDDEVLEMAVDLNRDGSDGFEVFQDPGPTLVERGTVDGEASQTSQGLHAADADDDNRIDHVVDTAGDGLGDVYLDPDRAQTSTIAFTVDVDGDGEPDHGLDTEFDGRVDTIHSPGEDSVYTAESLDFTGDGRREVVTDTSGDGDFDTFVDPAPTPPLVTPIEKDGDTYKLDTNGDGAVDTHYNAQTQSISDARAANLGDFFASYWWFLVVFVAVVALFGVLVYRRV